MFGYSLSSMQYLKFTFYRNWDFNGTQFEHYSLKVAQIFSLMQLLHNVTEDY